MLALASTPLTPLLHPNSSQQTEMKNSTLVVSPLVASADSTTPVLVLSPPNNRLVLSPASQAPANTPTCAKAATRSDFYWSEIVSTLRSEIVFLFSSD